MSAFPIIDLGNYVLMVIFDLCGIDSLRNLRLVCRLFRELISRNYIKRHIANNTVEINDGVFKYFMFNGETFCKSAEGIVYFQRHRASVLIDDTDYTMPSILTQIMRFDYKFYTDNNERDLIYKLHKDGENETIEILGAINRNNGPALIKKHCILWYVNGLRHREKEPAVIEMNDDKKITTESWYLRGMKHREDGPASIYYLRKERFWSWEGKIHRNGGPAVEIQNERHWYHHGNIYKTGGIQVLKNGDNEWLLIGTLELIERRVEKCYSLFKKENHKIICGPMYVKQNFNIWLLKGTMYPLYPGRRTIENGEFIRYPVYTEDGLEYVTVKNNSIGDDGECAIHFKL